MDEMTASFHVTSHQRNVRYESVLRVKKDLSPSILAEWLSGTQQDIIPKVCVQNANNPAFDRGLSYTYAYSSIHGQKMGDIYVDKETCQRLGY